MPLYSGISKADCIRCFQTLSSQSFLHFILQSHPIKYDDISSLKCKNIAIEASSNTCNPFIWESMNINVITKHGLYPISIHQDLNARLQISFPFFFDLRRVDNFLKQLYPCTILSLNYHTQSLCFYLLVIDLNIGSNPRPTCPALSNRTTFSSLTIKFCD